MLDFLREWPWLPAREGNTHQVASGSEKRRWFTRGSVEVNNEKVEATDPWPQPGDRVVIHPNGKHRTTLL